MENEISPAIWLDIHDLRLPLEEAQETLRAIRRDEVDALVVRPEEDARVLTLAGADQIYRALQETSNEGALTLTPDARILSANDCFAAMLDRAPAQVTGAPLAQFVAPEEQPHLESLLAAGRQGASKGEASLLRANGDRVPVLLSLRAVPVAGVGRLLTAVVTDLTELRRAQAALERANADLEARVVERTAALLAAAQRKDEFVAMLSHELRNPLSALSNALYLLRQRGAEPAAARTHELMERQLRQLLRLCNDLTDVAQINQGKIGLIPIRLDLPRLVSDAVDDQRDAMEKAGLTLALDLPPHPVWVEGDPDRLLQVLGNLLRNAVKFTPAGGRVGVQVFRCSGVQAGNDELAFDPAGPEHLNTRTPEHLNTRTPERLNTAVLTVTDTGIGIEPELLPHLFESFSQGEESRNRSPRGLRLGLAIVKGLIELHGGSVSVHSDGPGQGAQFTLRLPLLAD